MMLQFERKTAHQSSTVNKTKNFLALNKSLVKSKSKKPQETNSRRKETDPPTTNKRKSSNIPSTAIKHEPAALTNDNNKETVTISKDYLEQLLRQNFTVKDSSTQFNSLPSPKPSRHLPTERKTSTSPSKHTHHIEVDHSQIPGLEYYTTPRNKGQEVDDVNSTVVITREEEDVVLPSPHVSYESPRHAQSYHRGTMNRPIHPAMRSSINFGGGGGGGGGGDYDRIKLPQIINTSSSINEKRIPKEQLSPSTAIVTKVHHDTSEYNGSPRSSMDLFQSQNDDNRIKELIYREELRIQIEENKRIREEERLKIEMENKREEERVERERLRLAREFEREKERQRQKELETTQKLALMYQKTQEAIKQNNKEKQRSNTRPLHTDHLDTNNVTVGFDLRSPSMLQALPESTSSNTNTTVTVSNKSPQRSPQRSLLPVKKNPHITGSQVSLHSTSSEEPTASTKKGGGGVGRNDSIKGTSGLIKETRFQRRQAIKKQINSKKSDSETEWQQQQQGRGKPQRGGGAVQSSGSRTLPNSIARSTKQALQRSLKEPNHNRTVRLRTELPQVESSPDCHIGGPPHYNTRLPSPPVPALAKRLAALEGHKTSNNNNNNDDDNDIHDVTITGMTNHNVPLESTLPNNKLPLLTVTHPPPPSPLPLPSVVPPTERSTVPQLPSLSNHHNVSIINRAPSCSPDSQPLGSVISNSKSIVLPPIVEIKSREGGSNMMGTIPKENTTSRSRLVEVSSSHTKQRQQIMQCLSRLKQNIVNHTHDVNSKMKTIL